MGRAILEPRDGRESADGPDGADGADVISTLAQPLSILRLVGFPRGGDVALKRAQGAPQRPYSGSLGFPGARAETQLGWVARVHFLCPGPARPGHG